MGALAVWLALFVVEIGGDVACPEPAEVSRLLARITPAGAGAAGESGERRVRLSGGDHTLHIELQNPAGERIGERDLDANERCADLAQAAAIVVAAWEAQLNPRVSNPIALPRSPPATTQITTAAATPASREPPTRFDLGLALMGSLAGGQVAPGARIDGAIAPAGRHLGLGVTLSGATARSEAVGALADAARWTRFAVGAGPDGRFDAGRTLLDAHAQLLAGLLHVEGAGLATNTSDWAAQLGFGAGARVGRPWGNATPWIGADVIYWAGHDRLAIAGLAAQGELPHLEIQVALGLSLGRFP
jgi:hypothetical protein